MTARLYLTHNDRYRVRLSDNSTVSCRWDDSTLRFVVKGLRGNRIIVTASILDVSPMTPSGKTIAWTSLGDCFRDMHKGKGARERKERWDSGSASPPAWRHPYQTAKS
jgi:hypothetical protein